MNSLYCSSRQYKPKNTTLVVQKRVHTYQIIKDVVYSAPMTCFIMVSQLTLYEILQNRGATIRQDNLPTSWSKVTSSAHSLWHSKLGFISYMVPSFCVSNKHLLIFILEYALALYPLSLIILTWICIELHDRNFRPLIWLWRPFHKCFHYCSTMKKMGYNQ